MAYFVLGCSVKAGRTMARVLPDNAFLSSWVTGALFSERPREPVELFWDPSTEDGDKVAYYDVGPVLMRADLVAALGECGVDNLETFKVVMRSQLGHPDQHEYVAVNIVGAIAAADMTKSDVEDASDGMLDVLFNSLVVDEKKTRGQLMFRLVESIQTVLVHDSVASGLLNRGGLGLTFTDSQDFSG